ncbi:MAG: amino acid ABC transporter permease [Bacilli bacterium]|nr:amino acid ABC transporter permease [Bacilli bacterium]MBR1581998.1 amino acid ABC transporter permease [Bacilli bacterium]
MNFNKIGEIFTNNGDFILAGIISTLILSIFGTVVGLILGVFLAYGKNIKVKELDNKFIKALKVILRGFCSIYSIVLRGTPMMVQALIFKYGCLAICINFENIIFPKEIINVINGWLIAGLIVITLNTAAYMGEIVQSGLNGVDKGQVEGARSLGMSARSASLKIILPQALRNALPTIGNEFIVNIKDSSVLNVITVTELYYRMKDIASTNYAFLECYFILALIYLVMTLIASLVLKLIEKKLDGEKISLNPFGRLKRSYDL